MTLVWEWAPERRDQGSGGDPKEWSVNAGLETLAREACQNSTDAILQDQDNSGSWDPRIDFTVIRLEGGSRAAFEDAIGWSALATDLRAMDDRGQVVGKRIVETLTKIEAAPFLTLLRVEDFGCYGLTGPDLADDNLSPDKYGNFLKLCRLDLFSDKDEGRGGSYGLGKSVYWRSSGIKTVVFNSTLRKEDAVAGNYRNRLLGVNQGALHRRDERRRVGRGYFGEKTEIDGEEYILSTWADDDLANALKVRRPDDAPGTSVLIVGFLDPDNPDRTDQELAEELRRGVAANFWPAIVRNRLEIRVGVDDGTGPKMQSVDPADFPFAELPEMLRRYDAGDVDAELENPGDVISLPIGLNVSRRKSSPEHGPFLHRARLLVTLSTEEKDEFENKFCLVRGSEMMVEAVPLDVPAVTYHAVVVAGAAIDPTETTLERNQADDFLRFAEPPSHDTWFRRKGKAQSSLSAHYVAPYQKNLEEFEAAIKKTLRDIFNAPPPRSDEVPKSLLEHLRLLSDGSTTGPRGVEVVLDRGRVLKSGAWSVEFTADIPVRLKPITFRFVPVMKGAAGASKPLRWSFAAVDAPTDVAVVDGVVSQAKTVRRDNGTRRSIKFKGVTDPNSHPVRAQDGALDIVIRDMKVGH